MPHPGMMVLGFVPLGEFSRGDVVGGIVEHGLNTLVLILL